MTGVTNDSVNLNPYPYSLKQFQKTIYVMIKTICKYRSLVCTISKILGYLLNDCRYTVILFI